MRQFDESPDALLRRRNKHAVRALNFAGWALWSLVLTVLLSLSRLFSCAGLALARCEYRLTSQHTNAVERRAELATAREEMTL